MFNKVKFFLVVFLMMFLLDPSWADTNGIWYLVGDVRPGTFGSDEMDGIYVFDDVVWLKDRTEISYPNSGLYLEDTNLTSKVVLSSGSGSTVISRNIDPWNKVGNRYVTDDSSVSSWWYGFDDSSNGGDRFKVERQGIMGDEETFFIVNSLGNVGIGTVYPSEKLEIEGELKANAIHSSSLYVDNAVMNEESSDLITVHNFIKFPGNVMIMGGSSGSSSGGGSGAETGPGTTGTDINGDGLICGQPILSGGYNCYWQGIEHIPGNQNSYIYACGHGSGSCDAGTYCPGVTVNWCHNDGSIEPITCVCNFN